MRKEMPMYYIILIAFSFLLLPMGQADSGAPKIAMETQLNYTLPIHLSDVGVLALVKGFAVDKNSENISELVVGIASDRPALLARSLDLVAQNYPEAASDVLASIQTFAPDYAMQSYVTLVSILQFNGQEDVVEMLNVENPMLFAEISGRGLDVQPAAGIEEDLDMEELLEFLDVANEN